MVRQFLVMTVVFYPFLTSLAHADSIITSEGALGCQTTYYIRDVALSAIAHGDTVSARQKFNSYLASGKCVSIKGWHYKILGRIGQYGDQTALLAGPTKDGAWELWYTLNEWVQPELVNRSDLANHQVASDVSLALKLGRRIEIHVADPNLTKAQCIALVDAYRERAKPDGQVSVRKPSPVAKRLWPWCVENFDGKGVFFNDEFFPE